MQLSTPFSQKEVQDMLYRSTLKIGNSVPIVSFTREANIRSWFESGSSLMRYCRRNGIECKLTIRDEYTGKALFRFYNKHYGGKLVTRLSGGCVYGGQNKQGMYL